MMNETKRDCEYLRSQACEKFDRVRESWLQCGRWLLPHRTRWLTSTPEGQRNNQHIVDTTHILAHRSFVAGFLEGNTSATRPWYRLGISDPEINAVPDNKKWLDTFTRRTLQTLSSNSNFYDAVPGFYGDYGCFNTSGYLIEEIKPYGFHFYVLLPGSYKVINNQRSEAVVLVREMSLNVKALVGQYGRRVNGKWDWSNFSSYVKDLYERGSYGVMVDVCIVVKENPDFDYTKPAAGANRRWITYHYECGSKIGGQYYNIAIAGGANPDPEDGSKFLRISYSKRKPFIIGKSDSSNNFEYGEKGPMLDALGLVKSLNKKAIGKDQALEQMLRPPLQGPASLRKSYVTTAPNSFVPLDAQGIAKGGLTPIFEINPKLGELIQDVSDLRGQVNKLFYADYLLYLSQNPKTRTATETNQIVQEQQLVIGPNLQSLNYTHNIPLLEYVMDYVLFEDPQLPPPPQDLAGQNLRPEFISVFAQSQRAADLPSIDRYVQMIETVGQQNPTIWDKANVDELADIYADRLYLPAGLNRSQDDVDATRQQRQQQQQRQQMLQETLPAVAKSAKDVGIKVSNS